MSATNNRKVRRLLNQCMLEMLESRVLLSGSFTNTIYGQSIAGGPSIEIGTLEATVTDPNNSFGTFTLDSDFLYLMSDAGGAKEQEFRFLQVKTYGDEGAIWNGYSPLLPLPTPCVDPPTGGWDYQQGVGGADASPFYENDTDNNPTTGNPYSYPGYPSLHSSWQVWTMDTPELGGAWVGVNKKEYDTFICYEDATRLAAHQVDVLGGYSWGVERNVFSPPTSIGPTFIPAAAIDSSLLATIQNGLNRSGFNGWTVTADDVILAPAVVATTHDLTPSTNIAVKFSKDMDTTTFTAANITIVGSSSGPDAWTQAVPFDTATHTLTLHPTRAFKPGEKVTLTVRTDVTDLPGNGIDGDRNGRTGPEYTYSYTVGEAKVDLIFCIDNTGSMSDDIDSVKSSATAIVNDVLGSTDARIALVTYRDFPVYPYGEPDDWTYRDVVPFTTSASRMITGINSMSANGGNDWDESVYTATMHCIDAGSLGGWRGDPIKKIIIVMGDAPPHDPEPFTGYTLDTVLTAAENADPVSFFTVVIGGSAGSELSELATESGGQAFEAADASQVVAAIRDAIEYVNQSPFADAGGPYTGLAGQPIVLAATNSYDPDGSIVSYEWDWDNDGVYDQTTTDPTVQHTWNCDYSGLVHLRVTDDTGLKSLDTASVAVRLPAVAGIGITVGRVGYDRRTQEYSVAVSVRNTGMNLSLAQLVIDDLLPAGVTVVNASGITADGKPYMDLSALVSGGVLAPNALVSTVIRFKNPTAVRFNFGLAVRGLTSVVGASPLTASAPVGMATSKTAAASPAAAFLSIDQPRTGSAPPISTTQRPSLQLMPTAGILRNLLEERPLDLLAATLL